MQCEAQSPELSLRVALIIRSYFRAYVPDKMKLRTFSCSERKKATKGYFTNAVDTWIGDWTLERSILFKKMKMFSRDSRSLPVIR